LFGDHRRTRLVDVEEPLRRFDRTPTVIRSYNIA